MLYLKRVNKILFSNIKNSSYFQSGRPRAVPLSNIFNVEKVKKWQLSHKEARKPNSDQYKFLRMILEHTEAFRIKFMSNFKIWIQDLKNHWIKSVPAQGLPTSDSVVFGNLNSTFEIKSNIRMLLMPLCQRFNQKPFFLKCSRINQIIKHSK